MTLRIDIDLSEQTLQLLDNDRPLKTYRVSTAANGPGEMSGSLCTPRGRHEIAEKIGGDAPPNTVFVGRVPTGETWSADYAASQPKRDWILTRILWLRGLDEGVNCGGEVDTYNRYIYIHGTPDTSEMGKPGSIGCVRMQNDDVIELFDQVEEGTEVVIHE